MRQFHFDVDRTKALSDGVFAIAMTLLILDIRFRAGETGVSESEVMQELRRLLPSFFSYLSSFYVIGLYWISHSSLTKLVARFDRHAATLNLTFLFFLSFLPFPTSLLSQQGQSQLVWIIYSFNISALGICIYALYRHLSRAGFISADANPVEVRFLQLRSLVVPTVFIASMLLSFASLSIAQFTPLIIPAVYPILRRFHFASAADELI